MCKSGYAIGSNAYIKEVVEAFMSRRKKQYILINGQINKQAVPKPQKVQQPNKAIRCVFCGLKMRGTGHASHCKGPR